MNAAIEQMLKSYHMILLRQSETLSPLSRIHLC